MRLVSRSVLREIWPPFLLGFAAYTFILLDSDDLLSWRTSSCGAARTFGEVAWLAVLSLPWIVVLTLPMAFLLGVLIGVGRLAGDSEVVALRSCGVGPAAIYRPALAAAAVLSVGVFLLYNLVLPGANEALSRSLARVAATSVVNVVQPRTFREVRSGVTLFFDRAAADGRSLQGVFVKLGEEYEKDLRVIVARRGAADPGGGSPVARPLQLGTLHEYDAGDPSRYRVNWSRDAADPDRRRHLELRPPRRSPTRNRCAPSRCRRARRTAKRARRRIPGELPAGVGRDPQEALDPVRLSGLRDRRDPAGGSVPGAEAGAARSPSRSRSSSSTTSCSLPARPGPSRTASLRASRSGFPTLSCSPAGRSRSPARDGNGHGGAGRRAAPRRAAERARFRRRIRVLASAASCASRASSTATCWRGS